MYSKNKSMNNKKKTRESINKSKIEDIWKNKHSNSNTKKMKEEERNKL